MIKAIVNLKGLSPYSQSRPILDIEKKPKESANDFEKRTWREHTHVNGNNEVIIPPMALKLSLQEAATRSENKVPGKPRGTWTKYFKAGVLVIDENIVISQDDKPYRKEDVLQEKCFMPSSGSNSGGRRVEKSFPVIPAGWTAKAEYLIIDHTITKDVFEEVVKISGQLIGIGRFRPTNGGLYGRFAAEVESYQEY